MKLVCNEQSKANFGSESLIQMSLQILQLAVQFIRAIKIGRLLGKNFVNVLVVRQKSQFTEDVFIIELVRPLNHT